MLAALAADGADLDHFSARAFHEGMGGWVPLTDETLFTGTGVDGQLDEAEVDTPEVASSQRIDVTLFRRRSPAAPGGFDGDEAAGYFTCGVFGPKHSYNLGTLWRSAFQLGATGIFAIADRGASSALLSEASDTTKAWRRIPMWRHDDWNSFSAAQPLGALLVAVEMGCRHCSHPPPAPAPSITASLPEPSLRYASC